MVAWDPEIGYVQGMNFIAAALLVHCNEVVTFNLLRYLMCEHDMREVYKEGFPGMHYHAQIVEEMIKEHLPLVDEKFEETGLMP